MQRRIVWFCALASPLGFMFVLSGWMHLRIATSIASAAIGLEVSEGVLSFTYLNERCVRTLSGDSAVVGQRWLGFHRSSFLRRQDPSSMVPSWKIWGLGWRLSAGLVGTRISFGLLPCFGLLCMVFAIRAWAASPSDRTVSRCEVCGYCLVGLESRRCPECGSAR